MNSKVIGALAFIAGAAVGSVVTWKVVKTKYDQIVQEEINSVKEAYSGRQIEVEATEETEEANEDEDAADMHEYVTSLAKENYTTYEEASAVTKPYVISPMEYGESDYETVSLTYFEDGVLTYDDDFTLVEDVIGTIGSDALGTFGQYEDDSVFVRNDKLEKDFEILKDNRKYADVFREKQLPAEEE